MIRKLWPGIALNLLALAFGLTMVDRLPARVASHWGMNGEVNGWMSRGKLVAFMPAMALVMAVILSIAPRLDPERRNFPLHAGAYWIVTNAVLGLLAVVDVLIVGFNLGWKIDIGSIIGFGIGGLFILLGNLLTRVRPNWIFGIRTPWTLSSDRSWRETHHVGGYAFVATGLAAVLTAIARPRAATIVLIVGVSASALFSVVWSYFVWKNDPDAIGRDA
ncbi:MAG TPA: SdpI family protein [Gemmatimonadales bacterium]|jgi:uncharacterized membrane protein